MESIKGTVVRGDKKGKSLGFPTANVKASSSFQAEGGIYAGITVLGDTEHPTAIYIREDKIIEAHLLDFDGDLYEKQVGILIKKKMRENMVFKNNEEAKKKIGEDVSLIREYFKNLTT